ncbi:MAG: carbon-nitrogen hydrolase family protein [Candidatus Omnitrophica bacterium]|nr:carbon-nitrogen hydrolase family protein [Candidatus Omnitrophota bacterium]
MRQIRLSIVNSVKSGIKEEASVILKKVRERIEKLGADKPDIILLSEMFANCPCACSYAETQKSAQSIDGPISEELSSLAKKFHSYIAFGLLRQSGKSFYNSIVLLDRNGKPVWIYDKVTPMIDEIKKCHIIPGKKPISYSSDFGRIGGVICFDINFSELAEIYFRQGTELLLFSSAFPGGRLLDMWAVRYGFNIMGSTWFDNNRVIDCTGATVGRTSDVFPYTTTVLNLNRRVVHMDNNLSKIENMLNKYKGDIILEDLRDEATCVITSLKKGLEVSELIKEFKITTLPAYFDQSRKTRKDNGGL